MSVPKDGGLYIIFISIIIFHWFYTGVKIICTIWDINGVLKMDTPVAHSL